MIRRPKGKQPLDLTIEHRRRIEIDRAHLAAVVESSDDAILSTDLDGAIQTWNPSCERMYGYTAAEAVGRDISLVFPEHSVEQSAALLARIAAGERIRLETVRKRKDGTTFDASVTVSPVSDQFGQIIGASTIARDVTELRQSEQRLRRADHQKNQFLAMLGHELRNPLAALRSATELMRLVEHEDPRMKRTQAVLERQTRHMARLIDGLLDAARIMGGKIAIDKRTVDLCSIVSDVIDDSEARLIDKGLTLDLELPEDPLWIDADAVRIAQVIDNVLSNAIKFTDAPGTVSVAVVDGGAGQVELTVRDTGRGIDPMLLPEVFEVFRQADQSFDRGLGGMGLGLSLVHSLVELHDGTVRAHSDGPGKGAEFEVTLPLAEQPARHAGRRGSPCPPCRILLIEDNRDAAELLGELLTLDGHTLEIVESGEDALDVLPEVDPHIVICDLGLPGQLTGFDVAARIRAAPEIEPVLIAVSGYGRPEDRTRSKAAGFHAHLTKPVDLGTMRRVFSDLLAD